ncbi:hypothetical protein DBO86_04080 [Pseudomonas indoloxydans]|uniref:Uncharacterized protein n=1 Tax=Ectopseudomonas oleovorans TaxID=301 RepID=A0A2T5PRD4_ECTOL|nr:hypothetical protein DBO86_04080 [Pseudomonas indoloxydans]SUD58255.1 Uncharacterised protein [Pseudomonas oleovorans]
MTLRTFAGLGALLSSNSAHTPFSRANAGAGDALAALLCQILFGSRARLVMGMLGRLAAAGVPVIQNERGNDL